MVLSLSCFLLTLKEFSILTLSSLFSGPPPLYRPDPPQCWTNLLGQTPLPQFPVLTLSFLVLIKSPAQWGIGILLLVELLTKDIHVGRKKCN